MIEVSAPHYLLSTEADPTPESGCWHFTLCLADGSERFEAEDVEPGLSGERLELLTVVRALESLDQPSRVTLVACSESIRKGVEHALNDWKSNGWRWEFFGQMVPVKNCDLWQRMDRALQFHQVECRRRRFDQRHERLAGPNLAIEEKREAGGIRRKLSDWLKYRMSRVRAACAVPGAEATCAQQAAQA